MAIEILFCDELYSSQIGDRKFQLREKQFDIKPSGVLLYTLQSGEVNQAIIIQSND